MGKVFVTQRVLQMAASNLPRRIVKETQRLLAEPGAPTSSVMHACREWTSVSMDVGIQVMFEYEGLRSFPLL